MSHFRRNATFIVALTAAGVALAMGTVATSANAIPTAQSPIQVSTQPENSVQDQISTLADDIYKLSDANFVDIHTDAENKAIHLFWKGTPPERVLKFISENSKDISIEVDSSVKISRDDKDQAVKGILQLGEQNSWDIQGVSMDPVSRTVTIGVGPSSKFEDSSIDQIREITQIENVKIVRNNFEDLTLSGRLSDIAPFKGGARTAQKNGTQWEGCSLGFSVLSGSYGKFLSARHCDPSSNNAVYNGDLSVTIAPGGGSVAGKINLDSQLIDPSASPATIGRIYVGSWSSNSSIAVQSWASNWVGDTVCLSGATSGNRCGVITDDSVTWNYNGYAINTILVHGSTNNVLAGSGDSGGPAYHLLSTGKAQARGIISSVYWGSSYHTSCGTYGLDPTISIEYCSNDIVYVPISTLLSAWGVSLEVG